METSVLKSVKVLLGLEMSDTSFDLELITHINSVFSVMEQLGMPNFSIQDESTLWSVFFGSRTDLEFIKTYMNSKIKLFFDPPQNSFLVDNLKKQCEEFEWRIELMTSPTEEIV